MRRRWGGRASRVPFGSSVFAMSIWLCSRNPWKRLLRCRIMRRSAALAAGCCMVGIGALDSYWCWMPLRFLTGIFLSCIFVSTDTWINELAEERLRGRIIGVYSMLRSVGCMIGRLRPVVRGLDRNGEKILGPGNVHTRGKDLYLGAGVNPKGAATLAFRLPGANRPGPSIVGSLHPRWGMTGSYLTSVGQDLKARDAADWETRRYSVLRNPGHIRDKTPSRRKKWCHKAAPAWSPASANKA